MEFEVFPTGEDLGWALFTVKTPILTDLFKALTHFALCNF